LHQLDKNIMQISEV